MNPLHPEQSRSEKQGMVRGHKMRCCREEGEASRASQVPPWLPDTLRVLALRDSHVVLCCRDMMGWWNQCVCWGEPSVGQGTSSWRERTIWQRGEGCQQYLLEPGREGAACDLLSEDTESPAFFFLGCNW